MIRQKSSANPVVMRRGVHIGSGNAESDDEFLFDCFVDHPGVDRAIRVANAGMVLAGRTGSGKTAVLRHIENRVNQCAVLDPLDMALSYVANSDSLRFLQAIGADLDLLFQVLWKHVLCLEYIRLRWEVESTEKSRSIYLKFEEFFRRDDRRKKAISYLENWQGKFWITMDQNVKELTETVEKKLHAEVGGEIAKFTAGGQFDKRMSQERKSEIIARTKKIISEDQLAELHNVVEALATMGASDTKSYYLLIDRLDERWVDDSIRFRLIKALLQSLRSFRKIESLKVLVALRSDVLERVVQETSDIAFQREKFEDYRIEMRWSKTDLRDLIEKRLNKLFRRQYTMSAIGFNDVFPSRVGQRETFEWMLERTLLRPRDVISFVNECIDLSDGQSKITVNVLRKAEIEYSRKRRDALLQEWKSAFPTLDRLLSVIIQEKQSSAELSALAEENGTIDEFCLSVCADTKIASDPLHSACQIRVNGKGDGFKVVQEAVAVLYRTGVVGLKLHSQDRFIYSHLDQPFISADLLETTTKIRLHPMLHAAYNLQDQSS